MSDLPDPSTPPSEDPGSANVRPTAEQRATHRDAPDPADGADGPSDEADRSPEGILIELNQDDPQVRRSLGTAFTQWAGSESDLRIAFIPDMFVAVDTGGTRGYLSQDPVRVEVWAESGADRLLVLLEEAFSWSDDDVYRVVAAEPSHADMIDPVIADGMEIDDVRHMDPS